MARAAERALARWRRLRWIRAAGRYNAALITLARRRRDPFAPPLGDAGEDPEPDTEALTAARDRIALAEPRRPTWMGDRLLAVAVRVRDTYDLDLATAWPRLWLVVPPGAGANWSRHAPNWPRRHASRAGARCTWRWPRGGGPPGSRAPRPWWRRGGRAGRARRGSPTSSRPPWTCTAGTSPSGWASTAGAAHPGGGRDRHAGAAQERLTGPVRTRRAGPRRCGTRWRTAGSGGCTGRRRPGRAPGAARRRAVRAPPSRTAGTAWRRRPRSARGRARASLVRPRGTTHHQWSRSAKT
ncbi:hypothetical protein NKH77_05185 [Streptomyces sp. M19]